jgi:hypothetical protein
VCGDTEGDTDEETDEKTDERTDDGVGRGPVELVEYDADVPARAARSRPASSAAATSTR